MGKIRPKKHWNEHVPKSVERSHEGKITILWNQHMKTVRTIPNYKVIIICDNEKETRLSIDTAFAVDRNLIKKKAVNI
jgi:F0F1-type ATP synthase epsilon subunit